MRRPVLYTITLYAVSINAMWTIGCSTNRLEDVKRSVDEIVKNHDRPHFTCESAHLVEGRLILRGVKSATASNDKSTDWNRTTLIYLDSISKVNLQMILATPITPQHAVELGVPSEMLKSRRSLVSSGHCKLFQIDAEGKVRDEVHGTIGEIVVLPTVSKIANDELPSF
jgi:hypothetical protein